jgi:hypothetical protein
MESQMDDKKVEVIWIESHQGLCYDCFHFCA